MGDEDPFGFHLSRVPHGVSDGDVMIQQTEEEIEEQIGIWDGQKRVKSGTSRADVEVEVGKEKLVETHQLSEQTGESDPQIENVTRFLQSLLSDDAAGDQQVERQTDGDETNVGNFWQR